MFHIALIAFDMHIYMHKDARRTFGYACNNQNCILNSACSLHCELIIQFFFFLYNFSFCVTHILHAWGKEKKTHKCMSILLVVHFVPTKICRFTLSTRPLLCFRMCLPRICCETINTDAANAKRYIHAVYPCYYDLNEYEYTFYPHFT